jgi:hypothetical protein
LLRSGGAADSGSGGKDSSSSSNRFGVLKSNPQRGQTSVPGASFLPQSGHSILPEGWLFPFSLPPPAPGTLAVPS